jgi:hypothetical protein
MWSTHKINLDILSLLTTKQMKRAQWCLRGPEKRRKSTLSLRSPQKQKKKNQNLWSIVAAHKEGNRRTRNGDRRLQAGSGSNTESNTDRISREMTQSNDELDSDTNLLEFSLQTLVRWEEIHSTEIER